MAATNIEPEGTVSQRGGRNNYKGGGTLEMATPENTTGKARARRYKRIVLWSIAIILLGAMVLPLGSYVVVVNILDDNATTRASLIALLPQWSGTGRLTSANLPIVINGMFARTDAGGN